MKEYITVVSSFLCSDTDETMRESDRLDEEFNKMLLNRHHHQYNIPDNISESITDNISQCYVSMTRSQWQSMLKLLNLHSIAHNCMYDIYNIVT